MPTLLRRVLARLARALALGVVAVLLVSGATAAVADDAPATDPSTVGAAEGEGDAAPADADADDVAPTLVSGRVALASGESSAGVTVTALDAGSLTEVSAGTVGASSGFELALDPGSYVLWFTPVGGTNARDVYAGGAHDPAGAEVLEVVDGQPLVLGDVVLPLVSVVAGTAVIEGDPAVGRTLTVATSGWLPAELGLGYQWLRDGQPIDDADLAHYTPTQDDFGRSLTVEVTGVADGLDQTSVLTAAVIVASGSMDPGTVTVTGALVVGSTLTATPEAWNRDSTFEYQWQRQGQDIAGATEREYTLTSADRGQQIRVELTVTLTGYDQVVDHSKAVLVPATLTAPTPRISGTARVDGKLTAVTGTWTAGATLSYQWYVGGSRVTGATSSSFTPRPADVGKPVTVRVTGSLTGYPSVSKSSAATKDVVRATFAKAPTPRITGTPQAGQTLRISTGTWSPSARFSYQWRVDGKPVSGATGTSYKVRTSDRGKRITVTVTARRDGYSTVSKTSAATARVANPFTTTRKPTISGTVRVGSTLMARVSGWSPTPSTLRYQWYADGKAIPGATSSKLKLTSSRYGARITVKVTASRSGYVTTTRTSAETSRVAAPPPVMTTSGTYKVGLGIAPGTYVATSNGSQGCYWERRDRAGDSEAGVLAWDYRSGYGRVIVTIAPTDKYFYTSGCGSWTKLMPRGANASTLGDGTHAVGIHVKPGIYRTEGSDELCWWDVSSDFSGTAEAVIDWDYVQSPGQIRVLVYEGESFTTLGCGTWTLER